MEQKPPDPPIPPDHQPSAAQSNGPVRPKKRRQWVWIVLLLVFALIFVLILRRDNSKKAAGAAAGGRRAFGGPVTLTTTTAKKGDIGVYLDAIGTVTPVYTTTIYNQVTGIVTDVHYREGQMVRKGDPLVDIDPRQYQAQVDTATGNLILALLQRLSREQNTATIMATHSPEAAALADIVVRMRDGKIEEITRR